MNANETLVQAEQRLSAGDVAGAERLLAVAWPDVAAAPPASLYMLALVRRAQRNVVEAERLLRRALAAEPNNARFRFALGELFAGAGAHAFAADEFGAVLRLTPNDLAALQAHAASALRAGRAGEAERSARQLATLAASAAHLELLARALQAQDKLEEALSAAEQALALDAAHVAAAHTRAVLLAKLGRNEDAIAALDALEARGVAAPALALTRGAALFNLTRAAEAESVFASGVERWPTDATLQGALANARWMRGEGEAFARDFEAAVARQPDNLYLRIGCADLLRRAEWRPRAEELLREGLARTPDDIALLQSLGVLLDEMDRPAEGVPLLQRALARAPRMAQIRANLAYALLRLGRGDEALQTIAPARAAEPLHQEWVCCETMALRQIGDPRYHALCDYARMVRPYDLAPPPGYSSIAAFNEALAASLMRLHVLEAHPLDQSLRGGSQTSRSLLYVQDEVIQAYLKALAEPIRAYIDAMGPPDPNHPWSGRKSGGFRLTGAWSVKLKANGYHINHLHPAGWISSAYYVSLPPVVSAGGGQEGWIKFGEPRWPTPGCGVELTVQPKEGRLVLFPSYMWHGTIPFSSGERLTAPFDAVPA